MIPSDHEIYLFIGNHWISILLWWVLTAINSMPTPTEPSGIYKWVFNILHVVGAGPMRIARIRHAVKKIVDAVLDNGNV